MTIPAMAPPDNDLGATVVTVELPEKYVDSSSGIGFVEDRVKNVVDSSEDTWFTVVVSILVVMN